MSNYPMGYPENRLIVNNVDLTTTFQMILVDGFTLNPPEPKLYTIEVPGGNGVIDLTESLSGDVVYNNREQDFVFKLIYPDDFEYTKTKLSNFLHGKFFEYKLTWDPEYTYNGRFTVSSYSHVGLAKGQLGEIVIHVTADPYKYRERQVVKINGAGGQVYYFPSGRKPVRPIIQTSRATNIVWKNTAYRVPAGAYRLNFVLFKEGLNEIYFNTYEINTGEWGDVDQGGKFTLTWDEAKKYTWDQFARINLETGTPANIVSENYRIQTFDSDEGDVYNPKDMFGKSFMTAYKWTDFAWNVQNTETWQTIKDKGWTWEGLNYNPDGTQGEGSSGSWDNSWGSGSSGSWSGGSTITEWDYGDLPDLGGAIAIIAYEWGDL